MQQNIKIFHRVFCSLTGGLVCKANLICSRNVCQAPNSTHHLTIFFFCGCPRRIVLTMYGLISAVNVLYPNWTKHASFRLQLQPQKHCFWEYGGTGILLKTASKVMFFVLNALLMYFLTNGPGEESLSWESIWSLRVLQGQKTSLSFPGRVSPVKRMVFRIADGMCDISSQTAGHFRVISFEYCFLWLIKLERDEDWVSWFSLELAVKTDLTSGSGRFFRIVCIRSGGSDSRVVGECGYWWNLVNNLVKYAWIR